MQPTLLRFFSRSSNASREPVFVPVGGTEHRDALNNVDEDNLKSVRHVKTITNAHPQNCKIELKTRPKRRVVCESSDEENCDDLNVSQKCLNDSFSSSSAKPCSYESTNLSAFACSSPTVIRKNALPACEASPQLKCQSTENLENSFLQSSVLGNERDEATTWEHLTLPFLKPEKIMDGSNRRPDSEEYDPGTLFVPKEFLAKQSPGMRQWWELKARYADVLLLFKVGKFYELYHMDASVAVNELGLVYMRGSYAHCGFPEVAFPRMAYALVKKGHKVGRVEQTESVDAMNERTRGRPACEKVVRREVCQLLTPGTCTASDRAEVSHTNEISQVDEDAPHVREVSDDSCSYLIAVSERGCQINQEFEFGVSLLDAVTGKIMILVERGTVGPSLKSLLNTCLSGIPIEYLFRGKQFWTAKDTISEIETANYFHGNTKENAVSFAGKQSWPAALTNMLVEDDPLGRSVKPNFDLAVSCFGAVIYYLRYCLIDHEVLSLGYLETYVPPDVKQKCQEKLNGIDEPFYLRQPVMVLDSITLANLDILRNNVAGTREGTLIERLDNCCTPFGTFSPKSNCHAMILDYCLADSCTRIHLLGSKGSDKDHPDSRAVLFEEVQYSRKNIMDFVATLDGFELVLKLLGEVRHLPIRSERLKSLVNLPDYGGSFPSLQSKISYFKSAFDAEKAKREGRITPEPGVDAEYDAAIAEIKAIESELDQYLAACGKQVGVRLAYWGTGRNRLQIEVPDSHTSRVPSDWRLSSQRKGVKRYRTEETQDWLNQLTGAEERKDVALRGIMRNIFAAFSKRPESNLRAGQVIYEPFLEIEEGLHPCLINTFMGGDLIANSIHLGSPSTTSFSSHPLAVLVTGPNMGGKSTLMRQTALLVLLAHLGCRIPATSCRLTPVDRIFSRLGASDRLLAGESTFLVELSETAAILRHATVHSLVLMDELGRGTSTHDGVALASAVLHYLANPAVTRTGSRGPRTLFSTHYHGLVDEVAQFGRDQTATAQKSLRAPVGLGHMACMVEEQADTEPGMENITFLYKFIPGACPKSYGFNAARLAHLPDKDDGDEAILTL
ncbi:DNA mismatch repair protein MSH6 [Fasciola gigantica]|uniref:DNA mismatch repair protein MSH6 n=1 Tax=Fasciola gigantica TaxID=46835 RepID=A0A504Z1W1_FASGI|nr:DNA mismatch repair protein MSH6 [Fasciola gigantica]